MTDRTDLPFKWVSGFNARRPLLPSEKRTTATGVKRMLPSARADMGRQRETLPWTNRAGNDWRGITPS